MEAKQFLNEETARKIFDQNYTDKFVEKRQKVIEYFNEKITTEGRVQFFIIREVGRAKRLKIADIEFNCVESAKLDGEIMAYGYTRSVDAGQQFYRLKHKPKPKEDEDEE